MTTDKVVIDLTDPETRAVWETAKRAKAEVESWPAWKRGNTVWETCTSDQRGEFYRRSVAQFSLEVYQPPGGTTWAAAGVGYVNGGFLTAKDAMNHAEGLLRRRCDKELLLWGQVRLALDE